MKLSIKEIAIFGMFGGLMYASKLLMQFLPNVHLLGLFIVALTVVYRFKALYPIYIYILLDGIFAGFSLWWIPYLYIWTVLWLFVMLLPKKMPTKVKVIVYALVCALHGLMFGTLYAPAQALMFGLNFKSTIAWIVAGLPYDCIHAVSNLIFGFLICPLVKIINMCEKRTES